MRLLYVDDEPDIREIAGLSLGLDPGLEVKLCSNGEEALGAVEAWRPDAILLDVMMPGLDGPATLQRLRALPAGSGLPVIFVTARAQSSEVRRFLALGAVGVISKPFDPMTLAAQTRRLLAGEGPVG